MRRALTLLACLAAVSCGGAGAPPPSVIVISLDTLRADRLSCYGYGRRTTPRLDAFAAKATRFELCWATAPWTVPSHASLFTGRFPFEHGATSILPKVRPGALPPSDNARPLPLSATTLAEVLGGEGYATAGFVANSVYLSPRMQLGQGFDVWDVLPHWPRGSATSPAWGDAVNTRALAWLDAAQARDPERPFLLFLNYYDTHRPYDVAPDSAQDAFDQLEALYRRVLVQGLPAGELGRRVSDQFDAALENLDRHLGALFDGLEARGVLDGALVVITSDHGEYFGEHALVEHSKDVYEEALSVPLIVKAPGQREGRVEARPASLVDVPRLVLDALPEALAAPHRATFPWTLGTHPLVAENHFSRTKDLFHPGIGKRFHRERIALRDGSMKWIQTVGGESELYDLDADPREARDVSADRVQVVARFAELWTELSRDRATPTGGAAPVGEGDMDALRTSGYAGGDDEEDGER